MKGNTLIEVVISSTVIAVILLTALLILSTTKEYVNNFLDRQSSATEVNKLGVNIEKLVLEAIRDKDLLEINDKTIFNRSDNIILLNDHSILIDQDIQYYLPYNENINYDINLISNTLIELKIYDNNYEKIMIFYVPMGVRIC